MKTIKSSFALVFALLLLLTGCGKTSTKEEEKNPSSTKALIDETDMFTDNDYKTDYDKNNCVSIKLNGDSISCDSNAVSISGTTISIKQEADYLFSGTLNNGMIIINADDKAKPHLIFDGVSITSNSSAPLYILEAEKVFVTLEKDTENTLANEGTFTAIDDNNIDGTVFSKQDLTFNGSGNLTVTSPSGHGIVCKDDLVFTGGTYTINSASHALDANDSVRLTNCTMKMTTGKDGIHAENTDDTSLGFVYMKDGSFNITSEGDGISAGTTLQINDGTLDIVSGGGSANAEKQTSDFWGGFMGGGMRGNRKEPMNRPGENFTPEQAPSTGDVTATDDSSTSIKGLKSSGDLLIKGGTFTLDSADDAVHSNASLTINNGSFNIASGDDAFHADDTLSITKGAIDISTCYEGLEALHINVSGGDIKLVASDDGLNAAGGADESGLAGPRGNDNFGAPGGMGGGMAGSSSSNGSIVVSGGNLYINSSGDGMDANGTLEITGGNTIIVGPTHGDTATLDYDKSGVITGGTFIGTGATGMAQSFGNSEQAVITMKTSEQSAETSLILKDSNGKVLLSRKPELSYSFIIISSPELVKGERYTIEIGSSSTQVQAQ